MSRFPSDNNGNGSQPKKNNKPSKPSKPTGASLIPTGGVKEISEPRCHICQSTYRREIDRYLVMGLKQSEIIRYFKGVGEKISRDSLSIHSRKHLHLHAAAIRRTLEKRAENLLADTELTSDFLLTKQSVLEIMLQTGYESVLSGVSTVEPKDLLAVIDKLEKNESKMREDAIDVLNMEFQAFVMAIKAVVSEEKFEEIYKAYEKNMGMESSTPRKIQRQLIRQEISDVEIIEEDE